METIKPCPFCGSENLEVRGVPFVGYAVTCWNDNCLARGPSRGKAEEAIKAWNKVWDRKDK
jgi:hypothetical protein